MNEENAPEGHAAPGAAAPTTHSHHPLDRLDRRQMTRLLAGLCLLPLIGCDDDSDAGADGGMGGMGGMGGSGGMGGGDPPDGDVADTGPEADAAPPADGWATGGTAAMVAKASYPNPFTADPGACVIVAETTDGPCTTATDLIREDISEGWDGLPVRLMLKIVDTGCNPLAGVSVKVWHTNNEGSYSGQTPNNGMCLLDQDYSAEDFHRGVQMTNGEGVVAFDTCYPGWYRGRAVHIHFQVYTEDTTYNISQIYFPEAITAEIFAGEPIYSDYGQPDTVFANDSILEDLTVAERDRLVLSAARMSDGAMLASKVITVA